MSGPGEPDVPAVPDLGIAAGPGAEVAEPAEPPAPATPLPSGRQIVSRGLLLAAAGSAEIRRASLYFGLVLVGLVGPLIAFVVVAIAHRGVGVFDLGIDPTPQAGVAGWMLAIAGIGLIALGVEVQAVAVAMTGARATGRRVTLHDAIVRSRQVFWRLVRAWVVLTALGIIANLLARQLIPGFADLGSTGSTVVSTLAGAPFCYAAAGLVLGDVGAQETLRRSIILARVRPAYVVAISLFALAATIIQTFAILTAVDLIGRVEGVVHLSLDGSLGIVAVTLVAFAATIAVGSLVTTVAAIQAAPQVVAFLALTHYSAGLDRVADPDPATPFRWVTRPMLAAIVAGVAIAAVSAPGVW